MADRSNMNIDMSLDDLGGRRGGGKAKRGGTNRRKQARNKSNPYGGGARKKRVVKRSGGTRTGNNAGGSGGGGGGRRLFVGNLPFETAWQDLKDHFRSCGEVTRADTERGWGIVEFASAAQARRAINRMDDTEFQGRIMNVREDREEGKGNRGSGGRSGGNSDTRSRQSGGSSSNQGSFVFIENLSWDTSWQDLKDFARQAAPVVHAEVFTEGGKDGGRSKGVGRIEFENASGARKAIKQLNGLSLDGRDVNLRKYEESSNRNNSSRSSRSSGGSGGSGGSGSKLYVGNLSWDTSWQDVKDAFRGHGEVLHADVVMGRDGRSRGYGIVTMASRSDANKAIKTLNGALFDGREIEVRFDKN